MHGTLSYCPVSLHLPNPLVFPLVTSGEVENSNFSFLLHLVSGCSMYMSDTQNDSLKKLCVSHLLWFTYQA